MKKDANAQLRAAVRSIVEEAMAGVAPDADRVNGSIMTDQIKEQLGDEMLEMSMTIVHQLEEKVMNAAAAIINQHNMTDAPGRMTSRTLRTMVDQFDDADDKGVLMRECATDLEAACQDFATKFSDFILHVIGPSYR